jgi:hypothetical protein
MVSPAPWRNGDAATAPASHAIARSLAVSGGPVNSRAQVSSQTGQERDRSAVGQVGRRVSRAHEGGDLERRARPVHQAEGCRGEESTGPRTPTLGVSCFERASQRLGSPPRFAGCGARGAEEAAGAHTPTLVCCFERALRGLVRRGLQAAELVLLRKQQVRTPRRSCAALSVLCVDWSAAVCRQKRPSC